MDGHWIGIDSANLLGVDIVTEALSYLAHLEDNSVDNINASHFVEHLTVEERYRFFNHSYRVLKPSGRLYVKCPHFSCPSAYGDPTHKWPPINEWTFFYLDEEYRRTQAPHCSGYECNFQIILLSVTLQKIKEISAELKKI